MALYRQNNKRQAKSAIHPIELSTICFNTVHLDLIGPFPVTRRYYETYNTPYRYVLTCIDSKICGSKQNILFYVLESVGILKMHKNK